jgi:hypothetical protein
MGTRLKTHWLEWGTRLKTGQGQGLIENKGKGKGQMPHSSRKNAA